MIQVASNGSCISRIPTAQMYSNWDVDVDVIISENIGGKRKKLLESMNTETKSCGCMYQSQMSMIDHIVASSTKYNQCNKIMILQLYS
jgi:hypothetical protein